MYDFMTHINRRAVQGQSALHDLDGAVNACAKTAWISE
jgi:hypothetical protein